MKAISYWERCFQSIKESLWKNFSALLLPQRWEEYVVDHELYCLLVSSDVRLEALQSTKLCQDCLAHNLVLLDLECWIVIVDLVELPSIGKSPLSLDLPESINSPLLINKHEIIWIASAKHLFKCEWEINSVWSIHNLQTLDQSYWLALSNLLLEYLSLDCQCVYDNIIQVFVEQILVVQIVVLAHSTLYCFISNVELAILEACLPDVLWQWLHYAKALRSALEESRPLSKNSILDLRLLWSEWSVESNVEVLSNWCWISI